MPNEAAANKHPDIRPMTESELVSFCNEEISKSIGGSQSADSDQEVTLPLDYYFGRKPGISRAKARDKDASRFVSMDVMDGVEATVEEIMPAFSTGDIAYYDPMDEQDEDQAASETDIVNYLFMEEYNGFTILQTAIKDTLLHKNCTGKAYWDEKLEVEYETHDEVPEMGLAALLEPESKDQTIEVVEQYVDKEGNQEAAAALQTMAADGGPQSQEDMIVAQKLQEAATTTYSIKIKKVTKVGRPVIINVPPEQTRVKSGARTPYLQELAFCAHEMLVTQSELIQMGYPPEVVNQLPDYQQDIDDKSRSRESEERDYTGSHRSVRTIRVHECYALIDFDGDGIAERRKVTICDSHLLSNEEFNSVSLIGGVSRIMPHKYKGISMFERLKDIQDAKTPVTRSVIEGSQLAANPRIGVINGKLNIDDVLTSRTGGVVRMTRPDAAFEFPNPQIPPTTYTFLEHMDNIRRDRGGGSVDMTQQAAAMRGNAGDFGLDRIMGSMELGNALLARNIGETFVRGIFLEMHNILRRHYPKGQAIKAKIGAKWVETVPSEWRRRTKVTVQVGASMQERARQSAALSGILEIENAFMEAGSVMYDESRHYNALADRIKLAGLRSPEKYFVDPDEPEGQQKSAFMKKVKESMRQQQERAQQMLTEAQAKLGEAEMMKAQADQDGNLVKYENEQLKSRIETLKAQLDAHGKDADRALKLYEILDRSALKLTELEAEHGRQLDAEVRANKPNGSDGAPAQ